MDWLTYIPDDEPSPNSATITYGVARSDSADGLVLVELDGPVVSQPSDVEVEQTILSDEFVGGSVRLDDMPYPGSVTVYEDSIDEDNILPTDDYTVDDDVLTIHALANDLPVTISYATHVSQMLVNDDFSEGDYELAGVPTDLTLKEQTAGDEDLPVVWSDVAHTIVGTTLHVENVANSDPVIVASYEHTETLVCSPGVNTLPYVVPTVTVENYSVDSGGTQTVTPVDDWSLEGDQLTLPEDYDTYVVTYTISLDEEWSASEQVVEEPADDTDEEDSGTFVPTTVTVGHDLQFEPENLVITVDGVVSSDYTLDMNNIIVNVVPPTERTLWLEYDADVSLLSAESEFRNGTIMLPYVPTGAVSVFVDGEAVASTNDDLELTVSSLVEVVSQYVVTYSAQVAEPYVAMPCTPSVIEGQVVQILSVDGTPTVIGCEGAGDSSYSVALEAADLAGSASDDAEESLQRVSTAELNITNVETSIQQLDQSIQSEVYARGESEDAIYDILSTVSQSANSLEVQFSEYSKATDDTLEKLSVQTGDLKTRLMPVDEYVTELTAYVSITADADNHPVLELGSNTWPVIAQLTNSELRFVQDGVAVAYINDQELSITIANVTDHIALGDWAWIPRSNGNLSLKWLGE